MISIAERPTIRLYGIVGATGYLCNEYPKFAIAVLDSGTFHIVHQTEKNTRPVDILGPAFYNLTEAFVSLQNFIKIAEEIEELNDRLYWEGK